MYLLTLIMIIWPCIFLIYFGNSFLLYFAKVVVFEGLQFFFSLKVIFNTVGEALVLLFSCSVISDSLQPHGLQHVGFTSLSFTIFWSLLRLMSVESMMPSNSLTLCHPLLLLSSIFPSIRAFSNVLSLLIRWPKYSPSASVLPVNNQD